MGQAAKNYLGVLRERCAQTHTPILAHLQLTYRCNFRCVHCYCIHDAPGKELATEEWFDTLDQLAQLGCLEVILTGGEIFLRPDLERIIRHARRRRFNVTLFTNGYLIDETWAAKIRANNVWQVDIGLYGATESSHRAVTGVPHSTPRVRRAIDLLREQGVRVQLKAPLLRQLADDVEQLMAYARGRGVRLTFNPDITPRDDGDPAPLAHRLEPSELERLLQTHTRIRQRSYAADTRACATGSTMLVVSPFGDIYPCLQIQRSLGNLRHQPLTDIWRGTSQLLQRLRSLTVGQFQLPSEAPSATQMCAGINLMETGSLERVSSSSAQIQLGRVLDSVHASQQANR